MRLMFQQSKETKALVDLFCSMSIGQEMSFAAASKTVGFAVCATLPAYQSARKIAERDHRVVVEGMRSFGFTRIDGAGMLARGPKFFARVKKGARREARVQEIAISTNLTRAEMAVATEQLGRLRILEATSSTIKPMSNRPAVAEPDAIKPA